MKACILYFSGTGNTELIAKKISRILNDLNCETEIHSIEEKFKINPDMFDLLILGCPKYYEYPVLEFISYLKKRLPESKRTIPTMFFCTQAAYLKTNFNLVEKILKRKNYKLIVSKSFEIANNMVIFDALPLTEEEKIQSNLRKIDKELKPLLSSFMKRKVIKEKTNTVYGILTYLTGVVCTKLFAWFGVKYSATKECTGCGLCVRKCPKRNIVLNNKKPKFGKKCIFCMRCINICPNHAILYHNKQCQIYKKLGGE